MNKVTFYFPNKDKDGVTIPYDKVRAVADTVIRTCGGGATIYNATGIWKDAEERTIVAVLYLDEKDYHYSLFETLARCIKSLLNQETGLFEVARVNVTFV